MPIDEKIIEKKNIRTTLLQKNITDQIEKRINLRDQIKWLFFAIFSDVCYLG